MEYGSLAGSAGVRKVCAIDRFPQVRPRRLPINCDVSRSRFTVIANRSVDGEHPTAQEFIRAHAPPLRVRSTAAIVLIGSMLVQLGCTPTYRPPKKNDYFRAAPLAVEQSVPLRQGFDPYQTSDPAVCGDAPPILPSGVPGGERSLSLEEAIQIGLSNSGVVRVLDGSGGTVAAATFYDPEIADARARIPLAAFDPYVTSAVYSNWINLPPDAVFGPGLAEPTKRDELGSRPRSRSRGSPAVNRASATTLRSATCTCRSEPRRLIRSTRRTPSSRYVSRSCEAQASTSIKRRFASRTSDAIRLSTKPNKPSWRPFAASPRPIGIFTPRRRHRSRSRK